MEKTLNTMQDRLTFFIVEHLKISVNKFAKEIGEDSQRIYKLIENASRPRADFLEKVISVYPDLNINWLLMGSGEMIKPNIPQLPALSEREPIYINSKLPCTPY